MNNSALKAAVMCVGIVIMVSCASTPALIQPQSADRGYQGNCGYHDDAGIPAAADQYICKAGFLVGYNYNTKVADWSMYTLTAGMLETNDSSRKEFKVDGEVPIDQHASPSDFTGTGLSMAQLSPNSSVGFSRKASEQSFEMSNVAAQLPGLTDTGWKELEEYINSCVINSGSSLIVVTGPLYSDVKWEIGSNKVSVPAGFYKVVMERRKPFRMAAWVIPNRVMRQGEFQSYRVTVDQVEQYTNLHFFNLIGEENEKLSKHTTQGACSQEKNNIDLWLKDIENDSN